MSKRNIIIVFAVVLVLATGGLEWAANRFVFVGDPESVRALAEFSDFIKVGQDFNAVNAYLDDHDIEHSWHEHSKNIQLIIRDTDRDTFAVINTQFRILFDNAMKVNGIDRHDVYTGS